jgi:hypothetical protein
MYLRGGEADRILEVVVLLEMVCDTQLIPTTVCDTQLIPTTVCDTQLIPTDDRTRGS